jgi:hypothetical protein
MKLFLSFIIVGLCVIIFACSEKKNNTNNKIAQDNSSLSLSEKNSDTNNNLVQDNSSLTTAEVNYLLSLGFKPATVPNAYKIEHVRLTDVAQKLGFPIKELRPAFQQDDYSDKRYVTVETYIVIDGEFPKTPDNKEASSPDYLPLNNPDSFCKATVYLNRIPEYHQSTDSIPNLIIKSITPTKDPSKPLQVTFELSADGTSPIVIPQEDFIFEVNRKGKPDYLFITGVSFPEGTPEFITIKPPKPITLTGYLRYLDQASEKTIISGEYLIQITLNMNSDKPKVDYEWFNIRLSKKFKSDSYRLKID